jgi:hypothetical protein
LKINASLVQTEKNVPEVESHVFASPLKRQQMAQLEFAAIQKGILTHFIFSSPVISSFATQAQTF